MPIVALPPLPDTDRPVSAWPRPDDADWPARREQLVAQHLPLVRSVAGKLAPRVAASSVVDFDDLVGYGSEGLLTAIESFDPGLGFKFSTWAVLHIRTTIQDALRSLDPIGRGLRRQGTAIARAAQAWADAAGERPTDAQLAAALGLSPSRLRQARAALAMTSVSLDRSDGAADDDDRPSWRDRLADPDPTVDPQSSLDRDQARTLLGEAVAALPTRDRQIVHAYYHSGDTMRAVADRFGLSESRISQLHKRVLEQLRIALAETDDRTGLASA
jgi:RNA polymerase sigma factor for flagellar operon FliA